MEKTPDFDSVDPDAAPEDFGEILRHEVNNPLTGILGNAELLLARRENLPAGAVQRLEIIAELAMRHDLLVLSDEIYEKMLYDGARHDSIASFPGMKERTITVFAFSKTYAMTGWRVGYAIAPKGIIREMTKLQEFYVTCATSICQKAALAALEGPQDFVTGMVAEFKRRRDFMYDQIRKMRGMSCVKPKGAFYLFPNVSRTKLRKDDPAKDLLEKCKVVTAPGKAFGGYGDNYVRISLASSMDNLRVASERMIVGLGSAEV